IDTEIANIPHRLINTPLLLNDTNQKKHTHISPLVTALPTIEKNNIGAQLGAGFSASFKLNKKLQAIINYERLWLNGSLAMDSSVTQNNSIGAVGTAFYTRKANFNTSNYLDFNLKYIPNKYITLHAGRNRFFVGEGYRSLILSDNAAPMYHISFDAKLKQFQYSTTYAHLVDMNDTKPLDNYVRNKFMTFHSISYTPNKWLNLQLYETVVFASRSNNPYKFKYDVTYLNPIIFFRPVEYSQGSTDNEILGLNVKLKPVKNLTLYGQFVLDEFLLSYFVKRTGWWGNKYAVQGGAKYNYIRPKKQFIALAEFNYVRPFTYAHADPLINYGHYNQALAHPAGGNFIEALSLISYKHNNLMFSGKGSYFMQGLDANNNNYGSNIYTSYTKRNADFGIATLQGKLLKRITANLQATYTVQNTSICLGTVVTKSNINVSSVIVYMGLQATLFNHYNDY
ncbi:MAG: hypothetical protein H7331_11680, partial [Bacteroidia bacterium]|nr:hypothetical protein [Bacteroidia bacterium]